MHDNYPCPAECSPGTGARKKSRVFQENQGNLGRMTLQHSCDRAKAELPLVVIVQNLLPSSAQNVDSIGSIRDLVEHVNADNTSFRVALVKTLGDLKETNTPPELMERAFERGMDYYLGTTVPETGTPTLEGGVSAAPEVVPGLAKLLAEKLSMTTEDISEVFHFGDDGPELIVPSTRLPNGNSAATKEIAVLVAAARQGSGAEDWTPFAEIRAVCDQYSRLDPSNFATTMKELEDVFSVRYPSARKREVRLNRPGWEHAGELARRMVPSQAS